MLRFCLLLLAVGLAACSSSSAPPDTPAPADELSFELFPTTTLLKDDELATLDARTDGTLAFATAPASLAHVEPGNVILAGLSSNTPQGLLRVVISVKRDAGGLALETMQAPIPLAFRKLHVKTQRDVQNFAAAPATQNDLTPRALRPQGELVGANADAELPLDFLLFDADGDASTTSDQVGIHGSIGGGFHFGLSIDVDWGDVFDLPAAVKTCIASFAGILTGTPPDCSLTALLPEVKVTFEADPHMNADASLYGAASLSYEKDLDLASIPLSPIPIGPLVFIPSVDITAKVEGSAGAGFTVGAHGSVELTSSVALSSKHIGSPDITPIAVKNIAFVADETKVVLQATAKVGVGARLSVELYGIVGPYAEAIAYAEVKADALANPCWALHIGVDTVLGVRVTSPEIPFLGSITLLDWQGLEFSPVDEVISSGACLPVDKGPALPPGSGPDAATYATPTFTPWERSFSSVGDDGAVQSFLEDGREWTNLVPCIDGRYVAVGSRMDTIVKFDEAGSALWSRRYRREPNSPLLRLRRAVPTHDAAMMILAEAQDGEHASLLKIGQSGGVYFRKTVELPPEAACDFEPFDLVRDTQKGFYVLAQCLGDERAAIAHLDENADVVGVRLFGDPNAAGHTGTERTIEPSAMAMMGTDVVVLGSSSTADQGASMFAIRLSDAGAPAWANRIVGCSDALDLHPSQARINQDQQLTIVGTAADHRTGLVMRLKDDGSVAFANFPRFDESGDLPFGIHAFAELPTTGLLVSGSTSNLGLPAGQPGTESSLIVASLDAVGRVLWANRYTQPDLRSMNHASLRITDDGGAMVTGITQQATQSGGGLYAMKAYAKNGDLAAGAGVIVAQMPVAAPLTCAVTVVPWPAVVTDTTATTTEAATLVEDGATNL